MVDWLGRDNPPALTPDQVVYLEQQRAEAVMLQQSILKQMAAWRKEKKAWERKYDPKCIYEDYGTAPGYHRAELMDKGEFDGQQ